MKQLKLYLTEHLKIEINSTNFIFEKYGLFDNCEKLIFIFVNDIKRKSKTNRNFNINYKYNDKIFNGISNIFFESLTLEVTYNNTIYSSGEYIGIDNNLSEDKSKLKNVTIYITYNEDSWLGLKTSLTHELTHAYEDFNRTRKENVKTLKDIENSSYVNAINNLGSFSDSLQDNKKFVSFYIYLTNKSELNAFISTFTTQINNSNIKFDLSKEDIIKRSYDLLKELTCYKKYVELFLRIKDLEKTKDNDKIDIENIYNDICNTNKTFNQIKKEMVNNWHKIENKINSIIPKIICDYIDKNCVKRIIEKNPKIKI